VAASALLDSNRRERIKFTHYCFDWDNSKSQDWKSRELLLLLLVLCVHRWFLLCIRSVPTLHTDRKPRLIGAYGASLLLWLRQFQKPRLIGARSTGGENARHWSVPTLHTDRERTQGTENDEHRATTDFTGVLAQTRPESQRKAQRVCGSTKLRQGLHWHGARSQRGLHCPATTKNRDLLRSENLQNSQKSKPHALKLCTVIHDGDKKLLDHCSK
jgi:hypothetical protein